MMLPPKSCRSNDENQKYEQRRRRKNLPHHQLLSNNNSGTDETIFDDHHHNDDDEEVDRERVSLAQLRQEPELKTGKRERKKTEFLSATVLQSPTKKGEERKKEQVGKGVKLREIENVKFAMDKMKRYVRK
jgi:hypothetical protein